MSAKKKKNKPRPFRDLAVPALAKRNGKGAHLDKRKKLNKGFCRKTRNDGGSNASW